MEAVMTDNPNPFLPPSPQALSEKPVSWLDKYRSQFDNCPVGKSFSIDAKDVKLATLRPVVSQRINGDKKFRVIKHDGVYEIYRKE